MVDRIVDISDLTKDDIPIAGGKGANLGELVGAGFNVPPGFVLTTIAYDYFVKSNDIEKRMQDILEGIDASSESSLQSASVRIRGLFEQMPIPKDLTELIRSEWQRMWKGR
ncbi:MAG: phosphoenolpyruvate synthase, partial [Methanoregulaceae archaeon]|nr:phosphoenolpyruvate synthase [Methanoregulaceae archaeon]